MIIRMTMSERNRDTLWKAVTAYKDTAKKMAMSASNEGDKPTFDRYMEMMDDIKDLEERIKAAEEVHL